MACIGRVQPLQSILEHLQRLETGSPAGSASSMPSTLQAEDSAAAPAQLGHKRHYKQLLEPEPAAPVPRAVPEAAQDEVPDTPEGLWEALQQRVSPPLAGHMQYGRPLSRDEHRLVVGFAKQDKFPLGYLLDPENFVVVRDAAQALLGRPLQIVLEPLPDETAGSSDGSETHGTAAQQTSALEEVQRQKNELKQAVIDIFGATPI